METDIGKDENPSIEFEKYKMDLMNIAYNVFFARTNLKSQALVSLNEVLYGIIKLQYHHINNIRGNRIKVTSGVHTYPFLLLCFLDPHQAH